jgi:hypothetical protein
MKIVVFDRGFIVDVEARREHFGNWDYSELHDLRAYFPWAECTVLFGSGCISANEDGAWGAYPRDFAEEIDIKSAPKLDDMTVIEIDWHETVVPALQDYEKYPDTYRPAERRGWSWGT